MGGTGCFCQVVAVPVAAQPRNPSGAVNVRASNNTNFFMDAGTEHLPFLFSQ